MRSPCCGEPLLCFCRVPAGVPAPPEGRFPCAGCTLALTAEQGTGTAQLLPPFKPAECDTVPAGLSEAEGNRRGEPLARRVQA